jgi:hypothetical protein
VEAGCSVGARRRPDTRSHGANALRADGGELCAFLAEVLFQIRDLAFEAGPLVGKTGEVGLLEQ